MAVSFLDLIRIGTYAQMEGSCNYRQNKVQFTFFLNQIKDMHDLTDRVAGKPLENKGQYVRIYSMDLYRKLQSMGFKSFQTDNWNVPNINSFGEEGKIEYLRAVIDSVGNVDIDVTQPYVRLSSINKNGLSTVAKIFDARLTGPYNWSNNEHWNAQWKSSNALELLKKLNFRFNNYRNSRGAELIKTVRWENYV